MFVLLLSLQLLCVFAVYVQLSGNNFLADNSEADLIHWIQKTRSVTCLSPTMLKNEEQQIPIPAKTKIPRIVYMISWNNKLTFRNYLSLLSVAKILRPYTIELYTRYDLKQPPFDYNRWYEKAVSDIPNLQIIRISIFEYNFADEPIPISTFKKTGGVYINLNTIVTSDIWRQMNQTFYAGIADDSSIQFMALTPNTKNYLRSYKRTSYVCRCVSVEKFTGSEICSTIKKDIFPVDIMWANTSFASFARLLFYGSPNVPTPKLSFPPIPKLVHYVWFGPNDIDYTMFLSFLSTQKFVKPDKLLIYVNTRVNGKYFNKMREYSNVEIVFHGSFETVYQNRIAKVLHTSDIIRAEVLLRYGGIYIDWDVYWMKPVDDLLTIGYETIAALDFYHDMYPRDQFPDTINMGVLLARPNSRFVKLWQDSFKQYTGRHHTYHAVEFVYKIYEDHPDLLFIHNRLQIMCHKMRCHPFWLSDYKDDNVHHEFDFRSDVYSVHFTDPTPREFESEELLKNSKGFIADIGRYILE